MGLLVLDYMNDIIESRKNTRIDNTNLKFINFKKLSIRTELNGIIHIIR